MIIAVDIFFTNLDEKRVSKTESRLQVLPESIVQEGRLRDLLLSVLAHDELRRLAGRVNDQRVTVEPLQITQQTILVLFKLIYFERLIKQIPTFESLIHINSIISWLDLLVSATYFRY